MTGDHFNPIVVKELRQGLKSKSFLAAFLGLQGLMLLSMIIYLSAATAGGEDFGFSNAFFWAMIGLITIMLMPLRAFSAIYQEVKDNTLELVFLTHLSSWKISLGKWLALIIQTCLLLTAVLPYLVLRYFLGTIDLTGDLRAILFLLLFSMLFTAVGVGISGWQSKLLRRLIVFFMVISLLNVPQFLMFATLGGMAGGFGGILPALPDYLMGIWVMLLLMLYFVEYGASVIAPPAENHAFPKRLIGLVLVGSMLIYGHVQGVEWLPVLAFVCILPLLVDNLCEPVMLIPSIYNKRLPPPGVRWLFFPGWVSGIFFLLFVAAWFYLGLRTAYPGVSGLSLIVVNFITLMILPVAVVLNINPGTGKWKPAYIAMQTGCVALAGFLIAIHSVNQFQDVRALIRYFPHANFFQLFEPAYRNDPRTGVGVFVTFALVSLATGFAMRKALAGMVRLSRNARGHDAVTPART